MKKKKLLIGLLLACGMFFMMAGNAFALSSNYPYVFSIGNGTNYYQTEGMNSSGLQSVHYVEYKPNTTVTPIIAYGSSLYGKSTISYVADYLSNQGKNVIAGINADFFDTTTGIPIGIVINEGVFVSSNLGSPAIGFKADGTAIIGTPANVMNLRGANGGVIRVSCFNKTRSKYTVCLYDSNFGTSTKTTDAGTNIILERVNNEEIVVNGDVTLKVVSINQNTTEAANIKSNQMVLSASNDCITDISKAFSVGETVTFNVDAESTDWDDVMYAVSGKVMLDNGTVDVTGSPTGLNPRSAVGIKADGTVVLYEVDGRQSGFSVGMTMNQLAEEMISLGCVDAINLDGGGSSAIIIRKPGDSKYSVVNSPSDGALRKCANYIMLINNASPNGNLKNIAIYPEYKYLMKNATVKLQAKGMDSGYYATPLTNDAVFSASNGSINGNLYTAGSTNGPVVIKADCNGATGTQNLYVVAGVSSMSVVKKGETSSVNSLSLSAEEVVDLDVYNATYNGRKVQTSDKSVTWTTDIGIIDQEGKFTADKNAGTGKITVRYGDWVKNITVDVKNTNLQPNTLDVLVADFEKDIFFKSSACSLNLVSSYGNVHNGYYAMMAENMKASNDGKVFLTYTGDNAAVNGKIKIYGWFMADKSKPTVYAIFSDAEGKQLSVTMNGSLSSNGLSQLVGDIPTSAIEFVGFSVSPQGANSLIIDHVVMSGKYSADSIFPVVKITSCPAQINANDTASIVANVSDTNGTVAVEKNNIKVLVDGKEVAFNYNEVKGNVAFVTGKLSSGLHRVTVEAVDTFGNITKASKNIVSGTISTNFADIKGHWAEANIGFVANNNIVRGESVGGKNLFYPNRNLTRAEFAVIIARYLGLEGNGKLSYADKSDVKSWAIKSVSALYDEGIMTGSNVGGKTYFYPNNPVTRQEVMTVISKSLINGFETKSHGFTDFATIPSWSLPHINKLVTIGVVNGYADGTIRPKGNITRAEIAKIICELY